MDKLKLDSQILSIRDFITPPVGHFGGAFISMSTPFNFDCSNTKDNSNDCLNIPLGDKKELDYILENLLSDSESKSSVIKNFYEKSKFDLDTVFYLHIYRRF